MMNYFLRAACVCIFVILSLSSSAQVDNRSPKNSRKAAKRKARQEKIANYIRQQEDGALVFNSQHIYGFRLNTDGWSACYEYARMKSVRLANTFSLEFGEKKHPKEKKVTNSIPSAEFSAGTPYIYGKQNIFYQLKPAFGQQRMIGAKLNRNGIAIHWVYSGGPSIGLLRPYYVNVIYKSNGYLFQNLAQFNSQNLSQFDILYPEGYLFEGTGLRHGWNEMTIVPGLHAKSGLRFDYGRFNEFVSAIEVGLNTEFYFNNIPILANNDPKRFFFNAYVAILIGKRN